MYKHHHHSLRTCASVSLIRCWQCIMKKYLMYGIALRSKDSIIRTTSFENYLEANHKTCFIMLIMENFMVTFSFPKTSVLSLFCFWNILCSCLKPQIIYLYVDFFQIQGFSFKYTYKNDDKLSLDYLTWELNFTELVFFELNWKRIKYSVATFFLTL